MDRNVEPRRDRARVRRGDNVGETAPDRRIGLPAGTAFGDVLQLPEGLLPEGLLQQGDVAPVPGGLLTTILQ